VLVSTLASISTSLAQAAAPAAGGTPGAAPGGIGAFLANPIWMMLAIFAVFYFLVIRPQQRKQREQDQWLKSLKKGDEVVSSGGLIGKITGLTDQTVTLEVQEKVRLKVLRSSITGKAPGAATAQQSAPAHAGDSQTQPAK
jgi:preprotein translocase subunit YajC